MNSLRRILLFKPFLVLVLLLALYSGAGFFLAPYLLRHYGPRIVQERTGLRAEIGEVQFNPCTLTLKIKGMVIDGPDGSPMLGCDRLLGKCSWRSLSKRVWTFARIDLRGLRVKLVVERDGGLNLARLVPPVSKETSPPPKPAQGPPSVMVSEFALDQSRVEVVDRRPSHPAALGLEALQLTASSLTTLPGREGKVSLRAKVREGGTVALDGQLAFSPLAATGSLAIDGLKAATLFQFVGEATRLAPPEGGVSLSTDYRLAAGGQGLQTTLGNLKLGLDSLALRLKDDKSPLLELSRLSLAGGMDLAARRVDIEQLALGDGKVLVSFDRQGALNWGRIIPPSEPETAAQAGKDKAQPPRGHPWAVGMRKLAVNGLAVDYQDLRPAPGMEATIAKLRLTLAAKAELGDQAPRVGIDQAELEASGLRAGRLGAKAPMLAFDRLKAAGGELDLSAKSYTLASVSLAGGRIEARRLANGSLNLADLLPPPDKAKKAGKPGGKVKRPSGSPPAGPAPHFLVKAISISGLDAALFDELTVKRKSPILRLQDVAVTVKDVDGTSPMPYSASLTVAEGGSLRAAGTIHPAGLAVEGDIYARRLNLVPIQPYLSQVSSARLASGFLTGKGRMRYGFTGRKADNGYTGDLALENLQLTKAGEKQTLIGCKSMAAKQLRLKLSPDSLDIGDLRLSGPEGEFVIGKDHRLNLASVFFKSPGRPPAGKEPTAPEPKGKKAAPFNYRVRRVLIDGGRVDFADLSLFTPFGTRIHGFKGVVAGISSAVGARATVQLDGRVDQYGEAKLRGTFAPSDPQLFTDLALDFRNLEMARLTPYSGTFAGRRINSGKLSVALKYKIDHGELSGNNRFVVERLTLGDKVDSPKAVSLPLDLAVALLEDAHGVIELGLPVSGNLNSPEFSYGALMWKAITSLLTKIVTSPFRLLGALLPGFGDDNALKSVRFEPGSREVPPPEKEKLARLAQALQQRPQLTLTVTGGYNPETDQAELQRRQVARDLDALLGQAPVSADDPGPVDFTSPETAQGLRTLFARRFGNEAFERLRQEAKAKGAASVKKKGDETEDARLARLMFARLAAAEKLGAQELAKLAETRAQAVIAELVKSDGVDPGRLTSKAATALDPKSPIAVELNLTAEK